MKKCLLYNYSCIDGARIICISFHSMVSELGIFVNI